MPTLFSRRSFLALSAVLPWAFSARGASTSIPVGLELFSVRGELKRDPEATLRAVAQMGYQCVEFYAPYYDWTEAETKRMRKLRAADLNSILGSRYVVLANAKPGPGLDGWKSVADELNAAAEQLEPSGLKAGYHNHQTEFTAVEGSRPMEILAKNTKPSIMLHLDVGTCLEAGSDPVAWIRANPGRIRSLHCKDWSSDPAKGYSVLFGEGSADWKNIFAAAESAGGVEFYLVEQEGSRYPDLETAQRCLQAFRRFHPA